MGRLVTAVSRSCSARLAGGIADGAPAAPTLCRLLGGRGGGGFGLRVPARAAAAAHLLPKVFARFRAEVVEAAGHALLPFAALPGPGSGPPPAPEPAEENAAEQQQAEGLAQRDSW